MCTMEKNCKGSCCTDTEDDMEGEEAGPILVQESRSLVLNVIRGLSEEEWNAIRQQMPSSMTRQDLNEFCNVICLWVKEAVIKVVIPALITTLNILLLDGPVTKDEYGVETLSTRGSHHSPSPSRSTASYMELEKGVQNAFSLHFTSVGTNQDQHLLAKKISSTTLSEVPLHGTGSSHNLLVCPEGYSRTEKVPFVFLQQTSSSESKFNDVNREIEVSKEMLSKLFLALIRQTKEYLDAHEFQTLLESMLPSTTAQVVSSVLDDILKMCAKGQNNFLMDSQLCRFLAAVSDRIKSYTLTDDILKPAEVDQKSIKQDDGTSVSSLPDETLTNAVREGTPGSCSGSSLLSEIADTLGGVHPGQCISGDQLSYIAGGAVEGTFDKVVHDLIGSESPSPQLLSALTGSYTDVQKLMRPFSRLRDEAQPTSPGVFSRPGSLPSPQFSPIEPGHFMENVYLVAGKIQRVAQAILRDLFAMQQHLKAKESEGTKTSLERRNAILNSSKDIICFILICVRDGFPEGDKLPTDKDYLNSLIHGLEAVVSKDTQQTQTQVNKSCGALNDSQRSPSHIADNVKSMSKILYNTIAEAVMNQDRQLQTTDLSYHPSESLEKGLSKDSLHLSSTELTQKAKAVIEELRLSSDCTISMSDSVSCIETAQQATQTVTDGLREQIIMDFVETSVEDLYSRCLGLSDSLDEVQSSQSSTGTSKVECDTPRSVSHKRMSATSLITTAMVTEIMDSLPMARKESMDSNVDSVSGVSCQSATRQNIQIPGEQMIECDREASTARSLPNKNDLAVTDQESKPCLSLNCFSMKERKTGDNKEPTLVDELQHANSLPEIEATSSVSVGVTPNAPSLVSRVMDTVCLKIKKLSIAFQSGLHHDKKVTRLSKSVVERLSTLEDVSITEERMASSESFDDMVEVVYQGLLVKTGSVTKLRQAVEQNSENLPVAIASSLASLMNNTEPHPMTEDLKQESCAKSNEGHSPKCISISLVRGLVKALLVRIARKNDKYASQSKSELSVNSLSLFKCVEVCLSEQGEHPIIKEPASDGEPPEETVMSIAIEVISVRGPGVEHQQAAEEKPTEDTFPSEIEEHLLTKDLVVKKESLREFCNAVERQSQDHPEAITPSVDSVIEDIKSTPFDNTQSMDARVTGHKGQRNKRPCLPLSCFQNNQGEKTEDEVHSQMDEEQLDEEHSTGSHSLSQTDVSDMEKLNSGVELSKKIVADVNWDLVVKTESADIPIAAASSVASVIQDMDSIPLEKTLSMDTLVAGHKEQRNKLSGLQFNCFQKKKSNETEAKVLAEVVEEQLKIDQHSTGSHPQSQTDLSDIEKPHSVAEPSEDMVQDVKMDLDVKNGSAMEFIKAAEQQGIPVEIGSSVTSVIRDMDSKPLEMTLSMDELVTGHKEQRNKLSCLPISCFPKKKSKITEDNVPTEIVEEQLKSDQHSTGSHAQSQTDLSDIEKQHSGAVPSEEMVQDVNQDLVVKKESTMERCKAVEQQGIPVAIDSSVASVSQDTDSKPIEQSHSMDALISDHKEQKQKLHCLPLSCFANNQSKTTEEKVPSDVDEELESKLQERNASGAEPSVEMVEAVTQDFAVEKGSAMVLCKAAERNSLDILVVVASSMASVIQDTDYKPIENTPSTDAAVTGHKEQRKKMSCLPINCFQKKKIKKTEDNVPPEMVGDQLNIDQHSTGSNSQSQTDLSHIEEQYSGNEPSEEMVQNINQDLVKKESIMELFKAMEQQGQDIPVTRALSVAAVIQHMDSKPIEETLSMDTAVTGHTEQRNKLSCLPFSCFPKKNSKKTVDNVLTETVDEQLKSDQNSTGLHSQSQTDPSGMDKDNSGADSSKDMIEAVHQDLVAETTVADHTGHYPILENGIECDSVARESTSLRSLTRPTDCSGSGEETSKGFCYPLKRMRKNKTHGSQETNIKSCTVSVESVHALMKSLLVKVDKQSTGSQSKNHLSERSLRLSESVVTVLSENGVTVIEESKPGSEPSEEIVEAVYKDLLCKKGSAVELQQALDQLNDKIVGAVAESVARVLSFEDFTVVPSLYISSILFLSHKKTHSQSQKKLGIWARIARTCGIMKKNFLRTISQVGHNRVNPGNDASSPVS